MVLLTSMPCELINSPLESISDIFQDIVLVFLSMISCIDSFASFKLSACKEPKPPIGNSVETNPIITFCSSREISWNEPLIQVSINST